MAALCGSRAQTAFATARRDLLRMIGGIAAAVIAPRLSAAQTFTATSISQAAQDARRDAGQLTRRAEDLLREMVAEGPAHSARAVTHFRTHQVPLARELGSLFNTRVSEDDWLLVVPTSELDLALAMQPLAIRLAPVKDEVEDAIKQPLPQIEPLAGDEAADVLHTIVLSSLGLSRRVALFEQLRNDRALVLSLKDAAEAVKSKRYGLAALELERVMRAIVLPETVKAIDDNLGPGASYSLYKSLVVHFVPFVGWSYFTSYLLATIYLNRDTTATVLR